LVRGYSAPHDDLDRVPEWGAHLTFKGGTSLAKAWKLIERFCINGLDFLAPRLGAAMEKCASGSHERKKAAERLDCRKNIVTIPA
jgi:Nucleotidyl transferase AbiEii toxin, Type IV TA system